MFDSITAWITSAQGLIAAFVALILSLIAAYWQIREAIAKSDARTKLKEIATGAIADAETGEGKAFAEALSTGLPAIPYSEFNIAKAGLTALLPETKHVIATKITETKGEKLIKKLGKAFDVGMFVKEVYQSVKPAIKSLRKGK